MDSYRNTLVVAIVSALVGAAGAAGAVAGDLVLSAPPARVTVPADPRPAGTPCRPVLRCPEIEPVLWP